MELEGGGGKFPHFLPPMKLFISKQGVLYRINSARLPCKTKAQNQCRITVGESTNFVNSFNTIF